MNDEQFVGPDLSAPLPPDILELLERGRHTRTTILPGTDRPNKGIGLYALTFVEIDFTDEDNLHKCVKLLHWSDERLSKLPELVALWDWQNTMREGMKIYFSTGWYDKSFFEERNNAFLGRTHAEYFSKFGARPEDLKIQHQIIGDSSQ